jgi:DNA-binding response OmpR family regulator
MTPARRNMDTAAPPQNGQTIVLLEVDVLVRMTLAEYLRGCGYKVIEGSMPLDVFAILEAGIPVDIVLTEARLGGDLGGLQLARQLRARAPEINVMLTVGVGNAAEKAGELCDYGVLEKPFHPQELVRRIQLLRENHRAESSEETG